MSIRKVSQQCKFCGGWTTAIGSNFISLCPTCNVSFRLFDVIKEVEKHGKRSSDPYVIAKKISKAHGRNTPSQSLIKQISDLL